MSDKLESNIYHALPQFSSDKVHKIVVARLQGDYLEKAVEINEINSCSMIMDICSFHLIGPCQKNLDFVCC